MKFRHILIALGFLVVAGASPARASASVHDPVESNESRAAALNNRLEEIRAIDKSKLAPEEKKALRREVRTLKKELAAISGGIYLSVGAIILIALLLILLL